MNAETTDQPLTTNPGFDPRQFDTLLSKEIADFFHVKTKTVARWSDIGLIQAIRTAGGHRRYLTESVYRLYLDRNKDLFDKIGEPTFEQFRAAVRGTLAA